jgi:Immunity protein 40
MRSFVRVIPYGTSEEISAVLDRASPDNFRQMGPFAEHGSNNWALTRAEALVAIRAIEHESRVLLGGDVWLASEDALSPTGDSWHFEPNPHESHPTNVGDGAAKAKAYVAAYPNRVDGVPYFELVVQ